MSACCPLPGSKIPTITLLVNRLNVSRELAKSLRPDCVFHSLGEDGAAEQGSHLSLSSRQAQTVPGDSERGAQRVSHPPRVISCRNSSKLCSASGNRFRLASRKRAPQESKCVDRELSLFLSGFWSNDLEHFPWGHAAREPKTMAPAGRRVGILKLQSYCLSVDRDDPAASKPHLRWGHMRAGREEMPGTFWVCRKRQLRWSLLTGHSDTKLFSAVYNLGEGSNCPSQEKPATMTSGDIHATSHFYPSSQSRNHRSEPYKSASLCLSLCLYLPCSPFPSPFLSGVGDKTPDLNTF